MRYFLPFWPGDNIYKNFYPWKDRWEEGEENRIWEAFPKPPIDGVLVSLVNIKRTNHLRKEAESKGIHKALNFKGPVMGDCGAFSYVNELEPPFDAVQTLKYYKKLRFDIGVTVDHLVVKTIKMPDGSKHELTDEEKKDRWRRTIDNAKDMFDEAQKSNYENIRLIGISQGWNPESYADGIRELLDYGFDYVGLGGLARKSSKFIKEVLLRVHREIKRHIKNKRLEDNLHPRLGLHLFGIARIELLETMVKYGVTSFDSASPLRMAWFSSKKNYIMNDDFYTAIRIPIGKDEKEKEEEKRVLQKLRGFNEGEITAAEFVEELSDYNRVRTKKFSLIKEDIERTLNEKPWKKCDCPICDEIGIHVCVFRGCERNMRRGFHNVYQFHRFLKGNYPRVMALTWCTKKKDRDERLLPAYRRYSASNLFRTFWNSVYDLPVEIGFLSAKCMLINWNTRIPYYERRLTHDDLSRAIEDLTEKLRFFDKVFFIGLGVYREAVKKAAKDLDVPIDIFPKQELSRGRLDILEYNRQMKYFREAVINEVRSYLNVISTDMKREKVYKQTKLKA